MNPTELGQELHSHHQCCWGKCISIATNNKGWWQKNMIGFDKIWRNEIIYYLIRNSTEKYTLRLLVDSSNSRALQIIILQALTILFLWWYLWLYDNSNEANGKYSLRLMTMIQDTIGLPWKGFSHVNNKCIHEHMHCWAIDADQQTLIIIPTLLCC